MLTATVDNAANRPARAGQDPGMPTDDEHPDPRRLATAALAPDWRARVEETVRHIAAARGIDFTPMAVEGAPA